MSSDKPNEKQSPAAHRKPETEGRPQEPQSKSVSRMDKMTLVFEGAGLFVLTVYAIFTIFIWCANKKAADAAETAAKAAQQSAITTKEQVHAGQRAYLIFEHAEIVGTPAPNWSPTATVQLVNSGQTPALDVQACFHVVLELAPPKECSPYRSLGYIGAGKDRKQTSGMLNKLTIEQFNSVTAKEFILEGNQLKANYSLRLFAIGNVRYTDVFGGEGETTLCAVLRERDQSMVACTADLNRMKYTLK